ncbi:hypothetical protein K505DRAFT_293127 [Melanomma pulvis-pyrius CBS 109.77]|uniref:Uncharacterized protein n=1 Tax=Melanomma pulvis-pyrius CBS 109.77 TaxID=1314802 RepID=A0A6A6XX64_9PLEO|nr:hypothetical protein K505DRAFT_293127 [Melanomma pulvis-pyrius CBS 109.77]
MGAWGQRFFESDHDYDIVEDLTNDSDFGHMFYWKKQWLLLPKHPAKVRKHMNSGGLVKIFNVYAACKSPLAAPRLVGAHSASLG